MVKVRQSSRFKITLHKHYCHYRSQRVDYRTRSDWLLHQQEAWAGLYSNILDAYLQWDTAGPLPFDEKTYEGNFHSPITVYDIFGMFYGTYVYVHQSTYTLFFYREELSSFSFHNGHTLCASYGSLWVYGQLSP